MKWLRIIPNAKLYVKISESSRDVRKHEAIANSKRENSNKKDSSKRPIMCGVLWKVQQNLALCFFVVFRHKTLEQLPN